MGIISFKIFDKLFFGSYENKKKKAK